MGILGDIVGGVASAAKGIVNTVEDVAGGAAHLAEGVAGEALKVGAGVIGGVLHNPLELLNPFGILTGAAKTVVGDLFGGSKSDHPALSTLVGKFDPSLFAGVASAGGSVYDKIFAIMQKLQGQMDEKVNSLSANPNASQTETQQTIFQVQQLQSQITQLANEASGILKKEDDTKDNMIGNLR